jgi:CO/xanthine dehydrogenase Mo-binding subunit
MFEERAMDTRLGVTLNVGLHDYKIPTMADVPEMTVIFVDGSDTVANHVGARGIAEAPIIPTGAAIANAVAMAIGAEPDALPLTPWRVLGWLA